MSEQKKSQPSYSTDSARPIRHNNIFDAIEFNNPSEFKRLMEAKADLGKAETSALVRAVCLGRDSIVDMILRKQKIPDELNHALHAAAKLGHGKIVESLLKARANFQSTNLLRRKPLHIAADAGNASVVEILIKAKASFLDGDFFKMTPLHLAASKGHRDAVKTLLANSCDLDLETSKNETPLFLAAKHGHNTVVKTLLDAKAAISPKLLISIAHQGQTPMLQTLLAAGLNVNSPIDFEGDTILHTTLRKHGHVSFVRALMEARASLDAVDHHNKTPLHLAAVLGDTQIIHMLLMGIVNIEARDDDEYTPLLCAVNSYRDDAVQLLIKAKASMDFVHSESGDTILHSAVRTRYIPISSRPEDEAEYIRMQSNKMKVIETLLKAKASSLMYTPNTKGETPFSLALSQDEDLIVSLFNRVRETALLVATHSRSGRNSFWNKAKLVTLKEPQVFREIFNFGFKKPLVSNKTDREEETPTLVLK